MNDIDQALLEQRAELARQLEAAERRHERLWQQFLAKCEEVGQLKAELDWAKRCARST